MLIDTIDSKFGSEYEYRLMVHDRPVVQFQINEL